ncbi:hypothetical protein NECAME_05654 [Necator americanus]|nr:hypothetical protein NECAME_05654 [Necator americanus]ETN68380.1 hypothetical protein NECAME_05654 [Necator americanus]
MSDEEFEKIDRLSGGKLRHLLVGSPSGYEWNSQVETILQFEANYNEKRGIPVDSKMLPKEKREKFPEEEKPSLFEAERLKFLSSTVASAEWRMMEQKLLSDKNLNAMIQEAAGGRSTNVQNRVDETEAKAQQGRLS